MPVHRIDNFATHNDHMTEAKRARFPMVHALRSITGVVHDPAYPERAIYPEISRNIVTAVVVAFFHFGYANVPKLSSTKILTHGHRSEWRA